MKYSILLITVAALCVLLAMVAEGKKDKDRKGKGRGHKDKKNRADGCKFESEANTDVELSDDVQLIENQHPNMKALPACRKNKCHYYVEAPDRSYQLYRFVDAANNAEVKTVTAIGYTLHIKRCGGDRLFSKEDRAAIRNHCKKHPEKCQSKPENVAKAVKRRGSVKKALESSGMSVVDADATLQAIKKLQETIYSQIGIPMPEEAFDGIFERDLQLTKEQAEALAAELLTSTDIETPDDDDPAKAVDPASTARRRRAAFPILDSQAHVENKTGYYLIQKWITPNVTPIKWNFDTAAGFTATQKQNIKLSLDQISKQTCVKFQESNTTTSNGIKFIRTEDTCWSQLGRMSSQSQPMNTVNLGAGCFNGSPSGQYLGTIIHEVMHALGIMHEQARTDRNSYVKINFQNMKTGAASQFLRYMEMEPTTPPYDYQSLMHYAEYDFSTQEGVLLTIEALDPFYTHKLGDRYNSSVLTTADQQAINNVYCGGQSPTTVATITTTVKGVTTKATTTTPSTTTTTTTTTAPMPGCPHDVCTVGEPLNTDSCGSCAALICNEIDSECCQDTWGWDDICVSKAFDYCSVDEPCIYNYLYYDW